LLNESRPISASHSGVNQLLFIAHPTSGATGNFYAEFHAYCANTVPNIL
jgi:hypothetical protein